MKLEDFDIDNISIDEKSHENISIYDISYKTLIGGNPLRIKFDKINGFIRIYDVTRYLTLFGSENYDAFYKTKKQYHIYFFSLFCKNRIESYDFLLIEKRLTLHNVIILIK